MITQTSIDKFFTIKKNKSETKIIEFIKDKDEGKSETKIIKFIKDKDEGKSETKIIKFIKDKDEGKSETKIIKFIKDKDEGKSETKIIKFIKDKDEGKSETKVIKFIKDKDEGKSETKVIKFIKDKDESKSESKNMENENLLIVFTDGSCRNNGRKNAVASFGVIWPFHSELDFGCRLPINEKHTNNSGEYSAVIHAINQADILDPFFRKTLLIYTDSQLLINSLTIWLVKWKKNNWRKSDGEVISNLNLVQILDKQITKRNIIFKHVRAHTGNNTWESIYNNKVDKLAQENSK